MTDDKHLNKTLKQKSLATGSTTEDISSMYPELDADAVQGETPSLAQDSAKSEQKTTKEVYLQFEDGSLPEYDAKPKWKTAEKVIHGIVIGRGDSKRVIELDTVKKLAHLNLSYKDMADFFGCKETTFRDNFRFVVEQGRQKTKHRLMEAMLTNAIEKMNPVMQIWLSKNLMGFQDQPNNTDNNVTLPWVDGDEDD
jgi:AraC-like DNA-binding protein